MIALYVFGSRARGKARVCSDRDLTLELDDGWESDETVLVVNVGFWRSELSNLTGLRVKDIQLRRDPVVTGVVIEANHFARAVLISRRSVRRRFARSRRRL